MSTADTKNLLLDALPRLRRFAYSLTSNMTDADDLVQALVEKILRNGIPNDVNHIAWLLKVCKNLWLDEIRTRNNRERLLQNQYSQNDEADTGNKNTQEQQYQAEQTLQVIAQLPEEARLVVSLVMVEGFSYGETAEILQIPTGTVMSRLSRARKKLMELLQPK